MGNQDVLTLTKYVAQSGLCARRKAAQAIAQGRVTVNGHVVIEPWRPVGANDRVMFDERVLRPQAHVYVLLNKPEGFITTVRDERGRANVLELLRPRIKDRVYPIGRLDRDTTGLLVLTNDGLLAQNLAHPRFQVPKVYQAALDRPLDDQALAQLRRGLWLQDGFVKPDRIWLSSRGRGRLVMVQLHSGKNRVIRRLFARLTYHVIALERIMYAHLRDASLKPGDWRHLTKTEVLQLQHLDTRR